MFKVSIVVIALFVVAGFAFYLSSGAEEKTASAPKIEEQTASMLYAARKISKGSTITADDIVIKETKAAQIPQGAISKLYLKDVIGTKVKEDLVPGTFISNYMLDPEPWGANPKS